MVANADFVPTLQDLLSELWRGYTNRNNQLGPETTDDSNIAELVRKLKIMLAARRLSGANGRANRAREAFVAVAMMSWFELTVATNTRIVGDLKADADTREDRLSNLGARVKLASHAKSRNLFILADNLPTFLREIEEGEWDLDQKPLYDDALLSNVVKRTVDIVNFWSLATRVDLESFPVSTGS